MLVKGEKMEDKRHIVVHFGESKGKLKACYTRSVTEYKCRFVDTREQSLLHIKCISQAPAHERVASWEVSSSMFE